ncbi:MAG: helix-turn-helix domain-containing protein [Eubacterium sp.]
MENIFTADGEYGKRGYLKENYRVFSISDKRNEKFEFHYHEFDKIIFFISGRVTYIIEGREYELKPSDILLVRHGDIHKPVISPDYQYERVVVWVDNNYLSDLSHCFDESGLLRANDSRVIFDILHMLISEKEDDFAFELMKNNLFLQLIILINRLVISNSETAQYKSDKQIDDVIEYINNNLFENLTVDKIADEFFISRYYLMHKFKAATGKTIYTYIQTKRLLHSAEMLLDGATAKDACYSSGYNDYSVFLKAFKKEFGVTPTEYKN